MKISKYIYIYLLHLYYFLTLESTKQAFSTRFL